MKSLRTLGVLLFVFIVLGVYAWFSIVVPEREQAEQSVELLDSEFPDGVEALQLTTDLIDVNLEKRNEVWWITKPVEYLANQEFIEKSFRIMGDTVSNHHFPLEEDRFGLDPGKAFFRIHYAKGRQQRIRVGEKEGPAETIYLLDEDSREIFVVHNVWGQFLFYPTSQFYHPYLPIPGTMVKDMSLRKKEELQWKVEPAQDDLVRFVLGDKSKAIHKANGLWFFKKVKEFTLEDIEFAAPKGFKPFWFLEVNSDEGNIIFEFNESMDKIWVKRFNIFAQVNPYSLKSLGYEIEKVFKSDKE